MTEQEIHTIALQAMNLAEQSGGALEPETIALLIRDYGAATVAMFCPIAVMGGRGLGELITEYLGAPERAVHQ